LTIFVLEFSDKPFRFRFRAEAVGPARAEGCVFAAVFGTGVFGTVGFGTGVFAAVVFAAVFGTGVFAAVFGAAVFGTAVFGTVLFGTAVSGTVVFGTLGFGTVVFGTVVFFGSAAFGTAVFCTVVFFGTVKTHPSSKFGMHIPSENTHLWRVFISLPFSFISLPLSFISSLPLSFISTSEKVIVFVFVVFKNTAPGISSHFFLTSWEVSNISSCFLKIPICSKCIISISNSASSA